MTIAVLGAHGQVGRALVLRAPAQTIGFGRAECDITDRKSISNVISRAAISCVVNCAGYTAVDRAEAERDMAFFVNARGAENVAREAAARGLPVIHLSTDYVYDGLGNTPRDESALIDPLNAYGASKAAGDAAVMATNHAHIVLRVSWVFGVHGINFVKTMLKLGTEREQLSVVDDQVGGPTEARDIADAILSVADACRRPGFQGWGIYHFCGTPEVSWYEFARRIFDCTSRKPGLNSIPSSAYRTAAKRPLNSRLNCGKIKRVFGVDQPDWRVALVRVVTALGGK